MHLILMHRKSRFEKKKFHSRFVEIPNGCILRVSLTVVILKEIYKICSHATICLWRK